MFIVPSVKSDIPWSKTTSLPDNRYMGNLPTHWIIDSEAKAMGDIIRSDVMRSMESANKKGGFQSEDCVKIIMRLQKN